MNTVAQLYLSEKDLAQRWTHVRPSFEDTIKKEAQIALMKVLQSSMDVELQDLIGASYGKHCPERLNYRNGYRTRELLSTFGRLNLSIPRIRSGKVSFSCIQAYKRRTADLDNLIVDMFLAGISTGRVKEVLQPLLGPNAVSASTVSTLTKRISAQVNRFHARTLSDDYLYLICDGLYFNVKNPVWKQRRCVLVAYGITSTGIRELIDFELAPHGESEAAWHAFLNRLYHRGFQGANLRLIGRDGGKGLKAALLDIFPSVKHQPCWAHKMRNVSDKLPRKLQDSCVSQARDIYNAPNPHTALKTFKSWARTWNPIVPAAVKCLNNDIYDLLNFFAEPKPLWKKLRTTNVIERCFREVRRRTRPMECFNNQDSVHRIIYAIFARQNKRWVNKPLREITHKI